MNDTIRNRRTIRRFKQIPIPAEILAQIVDSALLAPSAGNRQLLRYAVISKPELVNQILSLTKWGAYVVPRRTPEAGVNGPAAFVAVYTLLAENAANPFVHADSGAAIENMLLSAQSAGLGGCWIAAFEHRKLEDLLGLPEGGSLYLAAFGYPAENPVCERIPEGEDIRYYLDESDTLHVPKHALETVKVYRS